MELPVGIVGQTASLNQDLYTTTNQPVKVSAQWGVLSYETNLKRPAEFV